MGEMLRRDYDWSAEVTALKMPTLLVFGDADGAPPSHAAQFFELPVAVELGHVEVAAGDPAWHNPLHHFLLACVGCCGHAVPGCAHARGKVID